MCHSSPSCYSVIASVSNSQNLCTIHAKPHFKLAICCVVNVHTRHELARMMLTVTHLITKSHQLMKINSINPHKVVSVILFAKAKLNERLVGRRRQQWLTILFINRKQAFVFLFFAVINNCLAKTLLLFYSCNFNLLFYSICLQQVNQN